MTPSARKAISIWLLFTALCVFGMIVLGGLTRLTESGLSIVHWKPFTGTLPPMTVEAWQAEFEAYRTSPQYTQVNFGMTLEEFKGIFWLEYLHRLAGRAIGFVFLLPFLWFAARKQLTKPLSFKLAGLFLLGGLQGVIGWYMVKSGLIDVPSVSPYRLALHLGTAFVLLGALIWVALDLRKDEKMLAETTPLPRWVLNSVIALNIIIFVQVLLGALVAGLDAGLAYNTFPLMDGHWVPNGLYVMEPAWRNHFENVTMVQFQHRIGAYITTFAIVAFVVAVWKQTHKVTIGSRLKRYLMLLSAALVVQMALGIMTLLGGVPIMLASKHQAVAALLFAIAIGMWHHIRSFSMKERQI
ncbi:MAG: heme A synthase [Alphaproteobacteria bacterium]|nr:heme A synthase [Alphaproteobacteria bacterium]